MSIDKSSPLYVLAFTAVVSSVFALGVSMVHYGTEEMLERNLAMHRNRTVARAFGLPVAGDTPRRYAEAVRNGIRDTAVVIDGREWDLFLAAGGEEIGFVFSGTGFWDRITGILVLSPDLETIRGIRFLSQKETPGLGARIEEKTFRDQFAGLPVRWDAPGNRHIIIGPGRGENRVDAISGATQTSLALMNILNAELRAFGNAAQKTELF